MPGQYYGARCKALKQAEYRARRTKERAALVKAGILPERHRSKQPKRGRKNV